MTLSCSARSPGDYSCHLAGYRGPPVFITYSVSHQEHSFLVWCVQEQPATFMDMDHSRLPYLFPEREVDLSHPRFGLDHNRCILCSSCVGVCDEMEGAHVCYMGSRGEHCRITSGLAEPFEQWMQAPPAGSACRCVPPMPYLKRPTPVRRSKVSPIDSRP